MALCDAEEFDEDILFSRDNWRHVEAGALIAGTEKRPLYLIPPHVHRFGPLNRTPLLSIGHRGRHDVILIPELEVARAWYFRSTDLVHRITAGPLGGVLKTLFNGKYASHDLIGDWQAVVRTGLDHLDAYVVAMLRCDPLAARRAMKLMDSLALAAASKNPSYMLAEPPLDGMRRLQAEGKWFESGGVRRFLVYRLTGVPFPENTGTLHWDLDNSNQATQVEGEPPLGEAWAKKKRKAEVTKRHELSHEDEPDKGIPAVHEAVRLPDFLDAPRLVRLPPRNQTTKGEPGYVRPPPSSGPTSTGVGGYIGGKPTRHRVHGDRQPKSDQQPRTTVVAGFPTLLDIRDILNQDGRARCAVVPGSMKTVGPIYEPRSEFSSKGPKGKTVHWAKIKDRARQFMVLQLEAGGQYAYAIEIEKKPKAKKKTGEHFKLAVVANPGGQEPSSTEFSMMAMKVALTKGVWKKKIGQMSVVGLTHSYKNNERFAAAVLAAMHDLLPGTKKAVPARIASAKSA